MDWHKGSWKQLKRAQVIDWYDQQLLQQNLLKLEKLPALVFADETRKLQSRLTEASEGKAFLLQCGNCAENFSDCHGPSIHNYVRIILQMALIISFISGKPVIKLGRVAGQYAKPRSNDTETVNGVTLPVYRGDMVNSNEFDAEARKPDPNRILEAYFRSTATLNLIRAFTKGGYASLSQTVDWQEHYFKNYPVMEKYTDIVKQIQSTKGFISALGIDTFSSSSAETDFFVSHEGLVLEYEEALTRVDTTTDRWYDTSAHMIWIGDRTRQLDGAHIEFARGINNPVGIKVGPKHDISEIINIVKKLNPDNIKGKVVLITRMGVDKIDEKLRPLVREVKVEGLNVVWVCDPMHGNTHNNSCGLKTRYFTDIFMEIRSFWHILSDEGVNPAGVHLEMTAENVTECIGGLSGLSDSDLHINYTSLCDPRLNAVQSVELAFEVAELIRKSN